MTTFIHELAVVEAGAIVGDDTRVWRFAHVRAGATLGAGCRIGEGVFLDAGVVIGDHCKIQNQVSIYRGVTLEDGVFVGPNATFTNDRTPRAIHRDGRPIDDGAWQIVPTLVKRGASIGAGAVICPGIELGTWCLIGAGAIVTRSVPPHALVLGTPGRISGVVDETGATVSRAYTAGRHGSVVIDPAWVP